MKISQSVSAESRAGDPSHFSGSVLLQDLGKYQQPNAAVRIVTFTPGARTGWHRHSDGQFLYMLEGEGEIATRSDGPTELRPGDLVYAPPGEEHWHGATADHSLKLVALSLGLTEWLDQG